MSNVKDVRIVADLPFTWPNDLPDEGAAMFARLLLSPSIGLRIDNQNIGFVSNDHGGHTAMYRVSLTGQEALSYPFLERVAKAFAAVGKLHVAEARDVQWDNEDNPWEHLVDPAILTGDAQADRPS